MKIDSRGKRIAIGGFLFLVWNVNFIRKVFLRRKVYQKYLFLEQGNINIQYIDYYHFRRSIVIHIDMYWYKLKLEDKEKRIKEFKNSVRQSGKSDTVYIKKINTSDLSKLFNRSNQTIRNWIKSNRLDPRSLKSICDLYYIIKSK